MNQQFLFDIFRNSIAKKHLISIFHSYVTLHKNSNQKGLSASLYTMNGFDHFEDGLSLRYI